MFQSATSQQRRALMAASLGWMLDAMDVLLYSLVLGAVQKDLGLNSSTSGLLVSLTLVTAAFGGMLFGWLADRWGRTRALMASILVYSVFTGLSGLSQNVWQLAVCRLLLGLGMGGEWATGAALVAETWPAEHRGKALGIMQSSWAVGYALAILVNWIVFPVWGWRAVFFVGVLPALATLWIRRKVEEPKVWLERERGVSYAALFRGALAGRTLIFSVVNACSLFAWWGMFTWIPSFLAQPVEQGGRGLVIGQSSTWMLLMQAGAWCGYVSCGFIADRFGAKRTFVSYLAASALLSWLYGQVNDPLSLVLLSPLLGFFCTGSFSGFAILSSEAFPTAVRGSAMGFTYNLGRIASAAAPYTVGSMADSRGLGIAFVLTAAAYGAASLLALLIPRSRH